MNVIGIDTSADWCCVGMAGDNRKPVERGERARNRFSERLFVLLDSVLNESGCDRREIEGIAVCRGPGSFTGVRIGLSAAKGPAHALDIPVAGVTSFEALSAGVDEKDYPVCCVVPVRGEKISYAMSDETGSLPAGEEGMSGVWNDMLSRVSHVKSVAGSFTPEQLQSLQKSLPGGINIVNCQPSGAVIAEIGLQKLKSGRTDNVGSLSPIYVHTITFSEKAPLKSQK